LGEVFAVGAGDVPDAEALAVAVRAVLADLPRHRAAYDAARPVLEGLTWEAQAGVLTRLYDTLRVRRRTPRP
jgi:hypothetical protein